MRSITSKNRRGGGNTLSYLLSMIVMLGLVSKVSADVIDLEGQTIDVNGSAFKSNYNGHTIENGAVNLTGVADNENIKQGVFTIGNGATVKSTGEFRPNHDCTFYLKNGGAFSTDVVLCIPFRYGNSSFIMDGGTFTSSATQTYTGGYSVNIGYVWNNKTVWADNSAQLIMNNGSVFNVTQGTLCFGKSKSHEKKVNLKVDVAVTNSSIVVSKGQIVLSNNDNAWITDNAKSYVKVVFGPDSHITTGQIYADGIYPTPSVIFDGATIHWTGNNSSFIGHRNTAGDIYTIDSHGLTVDIPSGKSLTCDQNASSLKGEGGITKIGEGSITWNKVSSNGSQGMTFTGPLVVSNGTWTSTLGYASRSFNVSGEGSVLELSGALSAEEVNFTVSEGGLLKLTGATTPNDTAPDMSISAGGVLEDVSTEPRTFSALALGEGCAVKVAGGADGVVGILADQLALSATEENRVTLKFSSASEIPVGTYAVITIKGDGVFAEGDDKKFSLEETVPENSQLTLSEDKKSLLLIVPATNPATWTGNAGDGKFSTKENWLGGKVPGEDDEIDIKAATDIELECDTSIAVKAISIHPESAKVTINGAGSITLSEKIVNASEKMMTVNVPVEFKTAEGGDAAIDVTGEVDFQGGVKGTVPVNHTTFYGNYTLTAQSWTLSEAITIAEGAKINAEGMKLSLNGNKLLRAHKNSEFKLSSLEHKTAGELFGDYLGVLRVSTIDLMNNSGNVVTLNKAFAGILHVDIVKSFVRSNRHKWEVEGETVIGNGGFRSAGGGYYLGAAGSRLVLRSSGNWSFSNDFNNTPHNGYYNYGYTIQASNLDIDTSDFDGKDEGHTVVVELGKTKESQPEKTLLGDSCVSAFGNGTFKFNNICYFTGGFTASNDVTVVVKKGVYPGKGDVTIKDTATFNLVDSASGTVPVAGKLTMEGGSTLHIPQFSASVVPISVKSFEFANVENNKKVTIKIDSGSLISGYNVILESDNAIPENAWSMIDVDISADGVSIPEGMEASYVTQGNALCILVKGANDCIWTGSGETHTFSDQANWRDGLTPSNGANLYIPVSSDITIINDIENFSPASITFSAGSGAVTIDGEEAIKVTAITNLSSSVQNIACRIDFVDTYRVHCATQPVNFSGGAYATYPDASITSDTMASHTLMGEIHFTEDWTIPDQPANKPFAVAPDSRVYGKTVTAKNYNNANYHLRIDSGAIAEFETVAVAGKLVFRLNGGDLRAKGDVTLGGENKRDFGYYNAENNGTVEAHGIYKNVTGYGLIYQYITSMVVGEGGYGMYRKDYSIQFCKDLRLTAKADLSIHKPIAEDGPKNEDWGLYLNGKTFTIDTAGHKVIFDSYVGNGANATSGAIVKEGEGELVMASLEKRYSGATTVNGGTLKVVQPVKGLGTGGVTVNDGGTLALVPGVTLSNSSVSVENGGAFACAESGTVVLGSDLNLADGAKLKFTFSKRNIAPVLNVAEKTVTLGENKALAVAIDGVKRPCAGRHVLTSGGKFAEAVVSLDGNHPEWVLGVGVNDDGNIYADIKPIGTRIIVR